MTFIVAVHFCQAIGWARRSKKGFELTVQFLLIGQGATDNEKERQA